MSRVPFKQVDVFTNTPYRGNPVAVIFDAQELSSEQMQRIANWTNLSETTFVLPPTQKEADYRLRIFTPQSELPFAGHPTLGTAHALIESGSITAKNGKLMQECGAGLVELTVTAQEEGVSPLIAFKLPEPTLLPVPEEQLSELESILGAVILREHPPKFVDVGPVWTIVQLESAQVVLNLRPDFARMAEFDKSNKSIGIVVYGAYTKGMEAAIEVRAFAPSVGVNEDPVCGSGNGAVAAFIRDASQIDMFGMSYLATQGSVVGRAGKLVVDFEGTNTIRIGGQSVTCIEGLIST